MSLSTLFSQIPLKAPQSQGLKAVSDPGSFSTLNHRKKHLLLTTSFHLQFQAVLGQGEHPLLYCMNSHALLHRY